MWAKIEEANQSVTVKFNLSNVCCGLDHYGISMRTHNLQFKTPQKSCIKTISILNNSCRDYHQTRLFLLLQIILLVKIIYETKHEAKDPGL